MYAKTIRQRDASYIWLEKAERKSQAHRIQAENVEQCHGQRKRNSRVQPMHTTLDLCARRAQLKPDPTLDHATLQLPHIPHADIL
jgi:hypothetical protein